MRLAARLAMLTAAVTAMFAAANCVGEDPDSPTDGVPDAAQDVDAGAVDGSTEADARPTYRDEVMADTPLSYWRFGETAGPTADDERGAVTGTYSNGLTYGAPGALTEQNGAVDFNGTEGCVRMPDGTFGFTGAINFTLEAWVKPDAVNGLRTIAGKEGSNPGAMGYAFRIDDGFVELAASNGTSTVSATATAMLTVGTYAHVAATYDGVVGRVYVNGSPTGNTPTLVNPAANVRPFAVGCIVKTTGLDFFDGVIDEVAVYDKALPHARIKAHYDAR